MRTVSIRKRKSWTHIVIHKASIISLNISRRRENLFVGLAGQKEGHFSDLLHVHTAYNTSGTSIKNSILGMSTAVS